MRKAPTIELDDKQRMEFESKPEYIGPVGGTIPNCITAAEGRNNYEIAARLEITARKRAAGPQGLAGIEKDAPRSGRIPTISRRKRARIVKKTLEEKPPNATHWSRASMAKAGRERVHGRENLAGPWTEASSVTNLQTIQRQTIRRKAGGCGRSVSEPTGKRHCLVLRRRARCRPWTARNPGYL